MVGNSTEALSTAVPDSERVAILDIVTYVGSSVSILGIILTLLSYIGYRKFRVKRPHIIMLNVCVCLLFYYLGYIISNKHRQHSYVQQNRSEEIEQSLCILGTVLCHFTLLAAWFWIGAYWLVLLVMFQRPLGGHISHFVVKSAVPVYGLSALITILCVVIANVTEDLYKKPKQTIAANAYYSVQCTVNYYYLYFGIIAPFCIVFIPMFVIFLVIFRGILFEREGKNGSAATSMRSSRVKMHFLRLSVISFLFIIMALSSVSLPMLSRDGRPTTAEFVCIVIFSVVSSGLGLALMILFCLHHEEIRTHWLATFRGKKVTMRTRIERGSISSSRKSSNALGNHPSLYIEAGDDSRKTSTYRMVAKEDTDMSTLGLIQIPGTPSVGRDREVTNEKSTNESSKVRRKKSDASSKKAQQIKNKMETVPLSPKDDRVFTELHGNDSVDDNIRTKSRQKNMPSRSTSTPPTTPNVGKTKRQASDGELLRQTTASPINNGDGKAEKRRKGPRFGRKSVRDSIQSESMQLTEY